MLLVNRRGFMGVALGAVVALSGCADSRPGTARMTGNSEGGALVFALGEVGVVDEMAEQLLSPELTAEFSVAPRQTARKWAERPIAR